MNQSSRVAGAHPQSRNFGADVRQVLAEARSYARRCVQLGPRSGGVFVAESIRRRIRSPRPEFGEPLADCHSIVFVCHGNILRSPVAAALFARTLAEDGRTDIIVSSAGLRARPGRAADPRGVAVGLELGVDLSHHCARQLTRGMVRAADAVIVMDFLNQADFLARFPGARCKLRLLGAYDGAEARSSIEIADPYMLDADAVRRCYDDVGRCVRGAYATLAPMAGWRAKADADRVRWPTTPLPDQDA